jgi:DHA1 family bicyclomycin/chloramphenicol resistance-like MFS transporter
VVTQASVRDNFSGRDMAQVMSLVFMVFMIMPVIAPSIGTLILFVAPWQGILVFSAALAVVIGAAAWMWLPESLTPERRRPLTLSSIAGGFRAVLSNRIAMGYTFAGSMMFGAMFGFVNASQQIYVTTFGLGALFAIAFMLHGFSMAIANFVNSRIVPRLGMKRIAHTALLFYAALGGALLLISLLIEMPLWLWLTMIALLMFCFGLIGSNINSLAMEPLGKVAGTAASVFGFLQTTVGALIGTFIGQHFDGTVRPIAAGFFVCGVSALGLALFAERWRLFRPEVPHVPEVIVEPPTN